MGRVVHYFWCLNKKKTDQICVLCCALKLVRCVLCNAARGETSVRRALSAYINNAALQMHASGGTWPESALTTIWRTAVLDREHVTSAGFGQGSGARLCKFECAESRDVATSSAAQVRWSW